MDCKKNLLKKISRLFIFLIVTSGFLFLAGCKENKPEKVKKLPPSHGFNVDKTGDVLVDFSLVNPGNLHPLSSYEYVSAKLNKLIYTSLVCIDKKGFTVPDLAEDWESSEDRKTLTFYLRKGVKWHDGKDFTAKDVKYTYEKVTDKEISSIESYYFSNIETVEVVDPFTVVVRYENPSAYDVNAWTCPIIPSHIFLGDLVGDIRSKNPPAIGTGPFKLEKWEQHEQVVLSANKAYYMDRPFLDAYTLRIIPDFSMAFLALKKGELDMMELTPDQFIKHADNDSFRKEYNILKEAESSYTFFGLNNAKRVLSDQAVRIAIAHSIDRSEIINRILSGYGNIVTGPLPHGHTYYNHAVKPLEYSLEKARNLLDQAGWKLEQGKTVREKDGLRLSFVLQVPSGYRIRKMLASFLKESLLKSGIELIIDFKEWGVLVDSYFKRTFEAVLLTEVFHDDIEPFRMWHSSQIPEPGSSRGGINYIGFSDSKVDALLEQAKREFDDQKRKELYFELFRLIHDKQPVTFLYTQKRIRAISKRFKGVTVGKDSLAKDLEQWYVPKPFQKYTN